MCCSLYGVIKKRTLMRILELYCLTCEGKTPNQCMHCFNCGFCVDAQGNGACIGGDYKGPYNYEKCARWYSGDQFGAMLQKSTIPSPKMGPIEANRIIGV